MTERLNWADLLIEDDTLDYGDLLSDWSWLLAGSYQVIAGSKFGDWFIERRDGQVEFLDAIEGTLSVIARSREEFRRLINSRERQEEWLLSPLVLTLHEAGRVPRPGQCYSFKIPPVLGGEAVSDNVELMDLSVWVSICGQLHRQVGQHPPGTKISGFRMVP